MHKRILALIGVSMLLLITLIMMTVIMAKGQMADDKNTEIAKTAANLTSALTSAPAVIQSEVEESEEESEILSVYISDVSFIDIGTEDCAISGNDGINGIDEIDNYCLDHPSNDGIDSAISRVEAEMAAAKEEENKKRAAQELLKNSTVKEEDITYLISPQQKTVYFMQNDKKYAKKPYGSDLVGTHGCGPTNLAMVISTLTDGYIEPDVMAVWAYNNGYWARDNGSYHSIMKGAATAFGLKMTEMSKNDKTGIVEALTKGKMIIVTMKPGIFCRSGGHFVTLRGITSEGKILISDSVNLQHSIEEWDLSNLISQMKSATIWVFE